MIKFVVVSLFSLLICINLSAQTQEVNDSLVNEVCKTIEENNKVEDSVRVLIAFDKHLNAYLLKIPEDRREVAFDAIFYRLQRNCATFKKMLNKLVPNAGDWVSISQMPSSKLNTTTCKLFEQKQYYTYLETNNDSTKVEIINGIWTDKFLDGTYSKLKFKWINGCEFELEFVESNNLSRKNLSKVGDKYRYVVVDDSGTYYTMAVHTVGTPQMAQFKMYY